VPFEGFRRPKTGETSAENCNAPGWLKPLHGFFRPAMIWTVRTGQPTSENTLLITSSPIVIGEPKACGSKQ
jgi:hypothetical protein